MDFGRAFDCDFNEHIVVLATGLFSNTTRGTMECAIVCVLTSKDFLNIVCFDQFYLTGFEVDQVLTTEANDYLSSTLQVTTVFITHVDHGLVTPHSKQQYLLLISALLTFSPGKNCK